MLLTGCRKSKILSLRWADVDLKSRVLSVNYFFHRVIEPPQLFAAGDEIRRQGEAADERSAAALRRYAIRHAVVTGRLLL